MVRSPLARRIATDDALNSVACFLPRFDRAALGKITDELTKPGEPGQGSDVIVNAKLLGRNAKVPAEVFDFIEGLPSYPAPDALASPLRRAKALAKLLTDDDVPGGALLADAGERLTQALNARLDGLAAENAAVVAANVTKIETSNIRRTTVTTGGEIVSNGVRAEATALRDIDRDTRRVVATIKEGVAKDYVRYRVEKAGADADVLAVRTEVAALIMVEGVAKAVEATATTWVQDRFTMFAVEIKNTTGATRDAYLKVKEQISKPEETGIELTLNLKAATKDSNKEDAKDLPTFSGHLYSDGKGRFSAKLNDWETEVIETELKRPSFVAGTETHRGQRHRHCASLTRMTPRSGARCKSTSSSFRAAMTAPWPPPSSVLTATIWLTPRPSSVGWRITPSSSGTTTCVSNPSPRSRTGGCAR
jgi:type III restriction enzyme